MPLPKYVEDRLFKELITAELYKKIISEQDINATDKNELTAIMQLILCAKYSNHRILSEQINGLIKKIIDTIEQQDAATYYYRANKLSESVLHFAIKNDYLYLPVLLEKISKTSPETILLTNIEGRNALHLAVLQAELGSSRCLLKLLKFLGKNPEMAKKMMDQEDLYGCTPMDLSFLELEKNERRLIVIDLFKTHSKLTQEEMELRIAQAKEKLSKKNSMIRDLSYVSTSQDILVEKMSKYANMLDVSKVDSKELKEKSDSQSIAPSGMVDKRGECAGLTRLWGLFVNLKKEHVFTAIKAAIANFDGTKEGLKKKLFSLLQRKYPYQNLIELYKQYENAEQNLANGGYFNELLEKAKDESEKNELVRNFVKRIRGKSWWSFDVNARIKKLDKEAQLIKKELGIESLNDDEIEHAKKIEGALDRKKKFEQLAYFERLKKYYKNELIILTKHPEQGLYKILSEIYSHYKNLSLKEKEIHPFKDILIEVFEKYTNLEDLLKEIVPVIAILQATSPEVVSLINENSKFKKHDQESYSKLFSIATSKIDIRSLLTISETDCSREEMIECLRFLSQFRNLFIEIGGGNHVTGVYINSSGKIKYYDSNWKYSKNIFSNKVSSGFDSIEELVDHMIAHKYNALGFLGSEKPFSVSCIQFPGVEISPSIPIEWPIFAQSQITRLEYAVMQYGLLRNKESYVKLIEECQKNPEGLYQTKPVSIKKENGRIVRETDEYSSLFQTIRKFKENNLTEAVEKIVLEAQLRDEFFNKRIKEGTTLLIAACEKGDIKKVVELLSQDHGLIYQFDKQNRTPLICACDLPDKKTATEIVALLIKANCQPFINQRDDMGRTALSIAAGRGNAEAVKLLLGSGVKFSLIAYKEAFIQACISDNLDTVSILLDKLIKADPGFLSKADGEHGRIPLLYACLSKNPEISSLILKHTQDGDINKKDKNGDTALILAADRASKETVLQLLQRKADVHARGYQGRTALIAAVTRTDLETDLPKMGDPETVTALLEQGDEELLKTQDEAGKTAADYARERGDSVIVELLESYQKREASKQRPRA